MNNYLLMGMFLFSSVRGDDFSDLQLQSVLQRGEIKEEGVEILECFEYDVSPARIKEAQRLMERIEKEEIKKLKSEKNPMPYTGPSTEYIHEVMGWQVPLLRRV